MNMLEEYIKFEKINIKAFTKDSSASVYYGRYDRDYFFDESTEDYNSYYAQLVDNAMMGDQDAMDELGDEFW